MLHVYLWEVQLARSMVIMNYELLIILAKLNNVLPRFVRPRTIKLSSY